jgi:hypothetical protein
MKQRYLKSLHSECIPGRESASKAYLRTLDGLDPHILEDIGASSQGVALYSPPSELWKSVVIASRFSAGWGLWSLSGE